MCVGFGRVAIFDLPSDGMVVALARAQLTPTRLVAGALDTQRPRSRSAALPYRSSLILAHACEGASQLAQTPHTLPKPQHEKSVISASRLEERRRADASRR